MEREKDQKECLRCGICCTGGGPALHSEDRRLVLEGALPVAQLITIRKGELAHNPLSDTLRPVKNELVKISGVGKDWNCCFFDPGEKGCVIYDSRPKACKSLKCWDTKEILELIEQDTLSRLDLIPEDEPIRAFVIEHDAAFPCPDMMKLMEHGPSGDEAELEKRVNEELLYRTEIVSKFDLTLGEELFYLGRPLFHLLVSIGASVNEVSGTLIVRWPAMNRSL